VDAEPTPDESIADPARLAEIEGEIGDILFVVANIARRWSINPEEALRGSNRKFETRFRYIEGKLAESGRNVRGTTLREMEDLYQKAKRLERERPQSAPE
jgi:tetrapyrrole methylase family protein/MazG family protein